MTGRRHYGDQAHRPGLAGHHREPPEQALAREVTPAHGSAKEDGPGAEYRDWARLQGRGPHTGGRFDRLLGWSIMMR